MQWGHRRERGGAFEHAGISIISLMFEERCAYSQRSQQCQHLVIWVLLNHVTVMARYKKLNLSLYDHLIPILVALGIKGVKI